MDAIVDRVTLQVNGEARWVAEGITLAALIAEIGLDTRKVAVELNLEIVPRSAHGSVRLKAGDALEIVHFIGGG